MYDSAQAALRDSPSPHQFDLSSATPATLLQKSYQQQSEKSLHHSGTLSDSIPSGMNDALNADVQSPVDLNTYFGMFDAANRYGPTSSASHEAYQIPAISGEPVAAEDMSIDSSQPKNLDTAFRLHSLPGFLQQSISASEHEYQSVDSSAAPLTPASFMNLPPNEYSLLTGLLADQPPQLQQHSPMQSNLAGTLSTALPLSSMQSSAPQASGRGHQRNPQTFSAEDIKQKAAAALAEKEAKLAARAREATRRQSQMHAQEGSHARNLPAIDTNTVTQKSGKRAATSTTSVPEPGEDPNSPEVSPNPTSDGRKSSHKFAEQRRRDSLKVCFEDLRFILPPINPDDDEDFVGKRPGENNVGGQRGKSHSIDPKHPNKGISKVALLRKSNECR